MAFKSDRLLENIESWSGRFIPTETTFEGEGVAFEGGDILFGKLRPYLAKAYLAEGSGEAVGDFHVLRPTTTTQSRFSQYQILNREFIAIVDGSTFGAKMPRVSWDFLGNMVLSAPPVPEQQAIAAFLDRETAKIDALIAEQQRLIELLKEKRQAVISHAVTKGLNPDAPMKDSGIAWLGEVPAHWEVRKLNSFSTKITNGYVGPTRDILVEDGVPYAQATHIKGGKILFDGAYFVTREWSEAHAKSILSLGDVLIVQTGAGTGDIGLVSENEIGFNCHALIIVSVDNTVMYGEFLAALLQSTYGRETLSSIQTGAMHPHLNCGEVKFIILPVPPIEEQTLIVHQISSCISQYDSLTEEAIKAIDLLKERRTALISAAVTGKIDVRGFCA
ncbi:restriction endonuclease subunit S [Methylomonas sp. MED-D]|uniref:restriction endonuclease subunit S n=1 Tax=Methylomonas sp. MED-D TaxID=3418768 RepID=UPI003D03782F